MSTECLLKMGPDCISEYHFWQTFPGGNPPGSPMEERRCPSIPFLNGVHALLLPLTLWTEPATQKPTDNPGTVSVFNVYIHTRTNI